MPYPGIDAVFAISHSIEQEKNSRLVHVQVLIKPVRFPFPLCQVAVHASVNHALYKSTRFKSGELLEPTLA